jgi:hypothetical protein
MAGEQTRMNNKSPVPTLLRSREVIDLERRRPARFDVHPSLVPLLRKPHGEGLLPAEDRFKVRHNPEPDADLIDGLGTARGIAIAMALAVPIWIAIGVVVGLLVR